MEDLRYQKIIDHLIQEELGNGKKITLRVSGDSMHPLIKQGDSIQLEKCISGALAIGDIITFKKDGIYVTHRVVWRTNKGNVVRLITKGDNEINADPPISPNHILGRTVAIRRTNRTLYLKTPFWSFMNRLLGVFSLLETISILLYRFTVGRFHLLRKFLAKSKPSLFYRRLKKESLGFTTRIIM